MVGFKNLSKGMIAALILSSMIAFMISLIPNLEISEFNEGYQGFPVFKQQPSIHISENNMVDFVSSLSIELPIKKVTWNHGTINIDFLIDPKHHLESKEIYRDLYYVVKRGLVNSNNTNEVILRVFLYDVNDLFVAISAQKTDIQSNPRMDIESSDSYRSFLAHYFGLNYGNAVEQN